MLGIGFKILLLSALIKLLIETKNYWLCAGIYGGGAFMMSFLFGHGEIIEPLITGGIVTGLAAVYFYLLNRFYGRGPIYWIILVVGLVIGLV